MGRILLTGLGAILVGFGTLGVLVGLTSNLDMVLIYLLVSVLPGVILIYLGRWLRNKERQQITLRMIPWPRKSLVLIIPGAIWAGFGVFGVLVGLSSNLDIVLFYFSVFVIPGGILICLGWLFRIADINKQLGHRISFKGVLYVLAALCTISFILFSYSATGASLYQNMGETVGLLPTGTSTPTPTSTPTSTPLPSLTPIPTATPTPTTTPTSTPTTIPTLTPTPSPTHIPEPTPVPTRNPAASATVRIINNTNGSISLSLSGTTESSWSVTAGQTHNQPVVPGTYEMSVIARCGSTIEQFSIGRREVLEFTYTCQ